MTDFNDNSFIKALSCEPDKRTLQELQIIYFGLLRFVSLSGYRDSILRGLSKIVRYEKHQVNQVLFYTGEYAKCWYILLSGAVFIGGSMFLQGASFGKRNGGSSRRSSECFVLETSEMIVIDYADTINSTNLSESQQQLQQKQQLIDNLFQNHQQSYYQQKLTNFTPTPVASISVSGNTGELFLAEGIPHSAVDAYNAFLQQQRNSNFDPYFQQRLQQQQQQQQQQEQPQQQFFCQNTVIARGVSSGGCIGGIGVFTATAITAAITTSTTSKMDHHFNRHGSANVGFPNHRPELYQKCNRGSHSSDTSSAYSGSDTMTSVHSSSLDADEVDLTGLVESVVDSDEEDLAESMDSLNVRDAVRECLEKDPSDRTEDDIETLLDFTQTLKAFTNMTLAVRRALCSVMVFAVVEKAGTMVMADGEELDSWSVLINGHVEIEHAGELASEKEDLQVGDSFGILPTMDKLYHRGVMRTKCDDCQFVCITQTDYYRIQHQGEENTKRHEENGKLVMVTELRHSGGLVTSAALAAVISSSDAGSENSTTGVNIPQRRGHVVIRGTPERLMLQLVEENSIIDPTYVEDFLLTHRTFIHSPKDVVQKLVEWFESESTGRQYHLTAASPQEIRDRVTRVVLLWVNNHFTDFETDAEMMAFLETFENGLEKKGMLAQLRLLHIGCAAKARQRTVTLARSSRDEDLHFTIVGGYERGYGIFISAVDRATKADDVGLKRGDQILEVNGQSFEHVTYSRAIELLMSTTHLSITVKSNLLAFKEMLQQPVDQNSPRPRLYNRRRICVTDLAKLQATSVVQDVTSRAAARLSAVELLQHNNNDQVDYSCSRGDSEIQHLHSSTNNSSKGSKQQTTTSGGVGSSAHKGGFMTLGPKRRIQNALMKMNLLPKNVVNSSSSCSTFSQQESFDQGSCVDHQWSSTPTKAAGSSSVDENNQIASTSCNKIRSNSSSGASINNNTTNSNNNVKIATSTGCHQQPSGSSLYHSHSNPDLTAPAAYYFENHRTPASDYPEHVLKVYKSDQTCKYLLINKETTAHEVVMLALQEFGIHETSSNFSLCEVSVGEGGMIKQRRLPDQLQNLAERIGLCARYYLKTNGVTETLVPDDMAPDLQRDANVHFLQLNANEVAIQLTFQDFATFRQIESTEYVDDLFELQSKYGVPMLRQFAELVNREMFWVVTEVCSEHNMVRRMKIIKQFIKIARHCKECRNFNSMFAIISGLGHAAVSRLRSTWEKLPSKYQKLFTDLQDLMDPSRNMSKYRQLVSAELLIQHPIIPFYPVVKKDLTFIHLGNDTKVEGLINFEKLRMIAKEVRILTHMCSSAYDLLTMLEFKGQPPSSAMLALNQMSVSTASTIVTGGAGGGSTNPIGGGSHLSAATSSLLGNYLHPGASSGGGHQTVKRRKKSTAAPNPKKMFEEAQMVRRVKAYLNNMKVITDEDALHSLSTECEPSNTGGGGGSGSLSGALGTLTSSLHSGSNHVAAGGSSSAPSSVTIRKRHPSPTLSTTSSTSSTSEGKKTTTATINSSGGLIGSSGPKFGTASPQAVKKILSLSEQSKTRPHQPRHPMVAGASGIGGIPLPVLVGGNSPGVSGTVAHMSNTSLHHPLHHQISPSPSPGAHRRMGSSSSAGSVPHNFAISHATFSGVGGNFVPPATAGIVGSGIGRATTTLHERSHSDTPTAPLPSAVDLSAESSSVTSMSNLLVPALRKQITSTGSVTSIDSGHESCIHQSNPSSSDRVRYCTFCSSSAGGISIAAPASCVSIQTFGLQQQQQQRRHSAIHGHNVGLLPPPLPPPQALKDRQPQPRHAPPAYSVASQMARLHRLGRAHSHEGVTGGSAGGTVSPVIGIITSPVSLPSAPSLTSSSYYLHHHQPQQHSVSNVPSAPNHLNHHHDHHQHLNDNSGDSNKCHDGDEDEDNDDDVDDDDDGAQVSAV